MKTVLAPLRLEGVGTPLVESMASYFLRLARVHQVNIGQLTQVVCNNSDYLRVENAPKIAWRALYPAMLCGCSLQAQVLAHRLEKLTGADNLTRGTLLALQGNIGRNQRGAIADIRRWCPQCYAMASDDFAEPLAWSLPLITSCPIHEIPLVDSCAHCGQRQRPWRIDKFRRHCHNCKRLLTGNGSVNSSDSPWERWRQSEMLKILEYISSAETNLFRVNAARVFVGRLPERMPDGASCRSIIPELRKRLAKSSSAMPSLAAFFSIGALWGTTPLDILLRPEEAASPGLFRNDVTIPLPPKRRPFLVEDYRRCKQRFIELMKLPKNVLLPPAIHVSREFHVSAQFQARYAALWKAYMAEKMSRLAHHKLNKVLLANRYMERHLERLQKSGQQLHRRKAVALACHEVGVTKTVARSALRVVMLKMRMNRQDSQTPDEP